MAISPGVKDGYRQNNASALIPTGSKKRNEE